MIIIAQSIKINIIAKENTDMTHTKIETTETLYDEATEIMLAITVALTLSIIIISII